jgi:hypothetical protein
MTNSGRRLSTAARALLLIALLGAACTRTDTTTVARGEYYAAGHPDYDEFFVSLYRFQLETAAALKEEQTARAELARGLGAKGDKPKQLSPLLKQRAEELQRQNVAVMLKPGQPPTLEISGEPPEEQRKFLDALRSSTSRLGGVAASTSGNEAVDQLSTRVAELERRSESAFHSEGESKISEVKSNLNDAQKLLVLISDSRKKLAQSSTELLGEIGQTFAAPPPPPPAVEEEPKPKPQKRAPRRSSAPPPKQASVPDPAPAPAPKPAPPKPAAPKPDFEP